MEAQAIQDGMRIKDVYYTGSDEMQSGYALCYDRDRGTASEVDPNRYLYVEKPAAGNLEHYVVRTLRELGRIEIDQLLSHRYKRWRRMGKVMDPQLQAAQARE